MKKENDPAYVNAINSLDDYKKEIGCDHRFEYATERIEYPYTSSTVTYTKRIGIAVCIKCGKIVETELF